MSCPHSDDDVSSRAASSNTNSASESGRTRNDSNSAENEPPCALVESGSIEQRKISGGRRSGTRRTER